MRPWQGRQRPRKDRILRHPWAFDGILTPPDIVEAPEQAILAVLDVALETAAYALIAEWPDLADEESLPCVHAGPPPPDRLPRRYAARIIRQAERLADNVRRYRACLEDFLQRNAETDHPDDDAF